MKAIVYVASGIVVTGIVLVCVLMGLKGDPAEEFLATDYLPLEKWFEEKFEVNYKHMTPDFLFDQVPLNGIFYESDFGSQEWERFHLESEKISRRDLLKAIADFYDFDMSISVDERGEPSALVVKNGLAGVSEP